MFPSHAQRTHLAAALALPRPMVAALQSPCIASRLGPTRSASILQPRDRSCSDQIRRNIKLQIWGLLELSGMVNTRHVPPKERMFSRTRPRSLTSSEGGVFRQATTSIFPFSRGKFAGRIAAVALPRALDCNIVNLAPASGLHSPLGSDDARPQV
jgi:hypothetical protein